MLSDSKMASISIGSLTEVCSEKAPMHEVVCVQQMDFIYISTLLSAWYCLFNISKQNDEMNRHKNTTQTLSLSHACWHSWIQTFHFVMESSFCKWIKLTDEFHIKTSNEKLRVQKAEEKARSEITCVSLAWCVQKDVQHTNKHQKKAKEVTTPNWYKNVDIESEPATAEERERVKKGNTFARFLLIFFFIFEARWR